MQLPSKNDLFNMYQQVSSKVKQYAKNLTPIEVKVEEATSNEPWGPHGTVMAEITRASFDFENYKQIMGVIARRLQSEGESWRHVYKSLLLLEYMCKHGPMKVVTELSSNISTVEGLERFQYKDKNSKDWGLNVRQRAKELRVLVTNPDNIQRERQKAKDNASKYTGVSSEESRMGGFGSSGYSGFSNASSSSLGGSALSKLDLGPKTRDSASLTGFGSSDSAAPGRYDEDFELGSHEALNTEDNDDDSSVGAVKLARRNTDARRKADSGSPVRRGRFNALRQGTEAEPRVPKKLSQVKVDPSIAKSLGALPRAPTPAGGTAAAPSSDSRATAQLLDVLGEADAATAVPASQSADTTSWGAFDGLPAGNSSSQPSQQAVQKGHSDDWASLLGEPGAGAAAKPPADPFAVGPVSTSSSSQTQDPFAPRQQATPAQEDPFATVAHPTERSTPGSLPLAPAPPQANQDPFAILAAESPHAALVPKPHSPLKATPGKSSLTGNASRAISGLSSLAPPQATANTGLQISASSKIGQALPEDMFAMPSPASEQRIRVQAGYPAASQQKAPQPFGQQSFFPQPQAQALGGTSAGSPLSQKGSMPEFQAFAASHSTATKDPFGSFSSAAPTGRTSEALGGGQKMAPTLPQPNLPPPVNKTDPFAGLAGF